MPASKSGWWLRVNTQKTQVNSITLVIGTRKEDRRSWRNWSQGDEAEFDVPTEFINVGRLYIHGTANPNGRNAWFCMMYKNSGVKHFDFDDDEDHERGQDDTDNEC